MAATSLAQENSGGMQSSLRNEFVESNSSNDSLWVVVAISLGWFEGVGWLLWKILREVKKVIFGGSFCLSRTQDFGDRTQPESGSNVIRVTRGQTIHIPVWSIPFDIE